MEIILMAKLMEIVSIYVCLYIHIYNIYLSIYTLPTIDS